MAENLVFQWVLKRKIEAENKRCDAKNIFELKKCLG
jgi:hypothetical protein